MIKVIPERKRGIERLTGITGLLISFLVIASIFTGMDLQPGLASMTDDFAYLWENLERLRLDNIIWFANSILIILFGPLILMSFLPHGRSSAYLAAFLITSTGMLYLMFAVQGYQLIYLIREVQWVEEGDGMVAVQLAFQILVTKAGLKLAAYCLAGISSIILGILIARSGHLPRFIGWMGIAGGMVYGSAGWFSTESILFTAGRLLFVLSLTLLGSYLLLKGIKRQTEAST